MYEEDAPPRNVETTFLHEDEAPEEHDMIEPQNLLRWRYQEREILLGQEKLYKKKNDM